MLVDPGSAFWAWAILDYLWRFNIALGFIPLLVFVYFWENRHGNREQ